MKLRRFIIVHLLTSGTFKAPEFPYVIQTRTCINYMWIVATNQSKVATTIATLEVCTSPMSSTHNSHTRGEYTTDVINPQ
jgi:hypothetical protein